MAEQPELSLEVDENDSALGDDVYSETDTVESSVYRYPEENGRKYHAYKHGRYLYPNDEKEQERLDLQHHLYCLVGRGALYLSPVKNPAQILDLGTGTGIWAIEAADQHPCAIVTGTDLSPIQPDKAPTNCSFQIFDFEDTWDFRRQFDLIHARLPIGSISEPRRLIQQAYDYLAPGGWLEFQAFLPPRSDDESIASNSAYRRWVDTWCEALRASGRDPDLASQYENLLREAGFVDIEVKVYKVPQNGWPKDPHYKELGEWNESNILEGIEGFSMRPFINHLGWSSDSVRVLLSEVRADIKNPGIHAYWPMYVVYGKKPKAISDQGIPDAST